MGIISKTELAIEFSSQNSLLTLCGILGPACPLYADSASVFTRSGDAHYSLSCYPHSTFPLIALPAQKVCYKSNVPFRQLSAITIFIQNSWRPYLHIDNMESVLESHHLPP